MDDVRPVPQINGHGADTFGLLLGNRDVRPVNDVSYGVAVHREVTSTDILATDPLADCVWALVFAVGDDDGILGALDSEDISRYRLYF